MIPKIIQLFSQTILIISLPQNLTAEDWWQFRGPNAGHIAEKNVPTNWGGFLQDPVWKSAIPGKGWSSPIVIGDRIWLTSSEQVALDVTQVADKLAQRPYGPDDFEAHASVSLFVIELNAHTGELLRRIELFQHSSPNPIHAMNSYASPTPVTDGTHVFCHFGGLGTACVDIESGEVRWKRELTLDDVTGSGGSPVLWNECLYLACDGADQQYVIAIDKRSGETKWKTSRPAIQVTNDSKRRSFSTPIIVNSNGRNQLISLAAQWLVSYNPEDGSEWWRARVGTGYAPVPTPLFNNDRAFVCTGYVTPELVAVDTTGSGDVSESAIVWRYARQVPEISSPILVDSEIYFVSTKGIATCLDAEHGTAIWQHRIGGHFAASPTYANGRIYLTSSSGVTTVIKPGKEYMAITTNELFGETYASLSVYKENLLLRTNSYLFSLSKSE